MSKPTPGPWDVAKGADQYVCASGKWVASTMGVRGEEGAANARLISAAPDLLASVIELLEPLERASAELVARGQVLNEHGEAAFDRARAAIAKATGAA